MGNTTSVFDCNLKPINLGDEVSLFGMVGTVKFECGAYGVGFDKIDWELIENKITEVTGCDNQPYFCYNDNFISFWELIWNFNCEDDVCIVIEVVS